MNTYKNITQFDLAGKTVLLRVDFNVPITRTGRIMNDARLISHVPTLRYLIEQGAKTVMVSHFGRPDSAQDSTYSLAKVAKRLEEILGSSVHFSPDTIGTKALEAKKALQPGSLLLLENTRFSTGEMSNDQTFAKQLAAGCDIFINDAFATCHRAHASTVGVTSFLPQRGIGLLMMKEMEALDKVMTSPAHPFVVIIGGAKVSSKFNILHRFTHMADHVLIGGAMANTFLAAHGNEIGQSIYEQDMISKASDILAEAAEHNCRVHLPQDVVVAKCLKPDEACRVVEVDEVPDDCMILDIGPNTIKSWQHTLQKASTILWNGPVGAFETIPFNHGTNALVMALAKANAYVLAGGGDTINAIASVRREKDFDYISTGGGALLEYLEGADLPALQVLQG